MQRLSLTRVFCFSILVVYFGWLIVLGREFYRVWFRTDEYLQVHRIRVRQSAGTSGDWWTVRIVGMRLGILPEKWYLRLYETVLFLGNLLVAVGIVWFTVKLFRQ